MSQLTIQKTEITNLLPHSGADRLELATVLGWQLVVQKGLYKVGDKVVYFPPDTVLNKQFSDMIGVTNYLSNGRIKAVKLRGEPSFGLLFPISVDAFDVPDENLAEYFGATKYEPPVKFVASDAVPTPPWFHSFTDIWNIRNFPDILNGHQVWVTEKIDGTSFRVGFDGDTFYAGSKNYCRSGGAYWEPVPKLQELARACLSRTGGNTLMIFGEIYGKGIQKLQYGANEHHFAVYDIAGDGKYAAPLEVAEVCREFGVPSVPFLFAGEYNLAQIIHSSKGKTTLNEAGHVREGVVVKDIYNGTDPKVGRLVGKYVSDEYLLKSVDTDSTDS